MPWSVEDVDSHKKGLTDKQKRQWVRIANSVLKALMKKGKKEKEAAESAIRQANGVVMNTNKANTYSAYKNKQVLDYEVKITVHQERPHLVVPVVMMVEGVHNGSQGPVFHSIEQLGAFPESWNGIPVVIYHPEQDGVPVSANKPDIIDNMAVGKVFNTSIDGKKLKAEIWLDEEKLNSISTNTLEDINETREVEVSLGMFTDNVDEEGEYEGEQYEKIAYNHRPDHLAILPDQIGACSCKDGCGIGANQTKKDMTHEEMIVNLRKEGFVIRPVLTNLTGGYKEQMQKVQSLLEGYNTDKIWNYLEEMDDKFFIYSQNGHKENKLYRQEYRFESGKIVLIDDPVEVHKKVDYIVNGKSSLTLFKKEDKMSKNECPKCAEKVNALIANKESGYTEEHREWLSTFTEAQLDLVTPKVIEKTVEKIVEVNKLTPEQTADLAFVAQQRTAQRNEMISKIQANTSKEIWPDDVLKGMSEDHLKRIFDSVKKENIVDYSLNGGQAPANYSDEIEPLLPTGVGVETKK